MITAIIVIIIIQAVVCGAFCKYAAKEKGKDPDTWLVLGFLFGIIALITLLASPSPSRMMTSYHDTNKADDRRKCPFCAEWVKIEATICRFCNRELPAYVEPIKTATFELNTELHPNECIKCGLRYPEGTTVCADCQFPLKLA